MAIRSRMSIALVLLASACLALQAGASQNPRRLLAEDHDHDGYYLQMHPITLRSVQNITGVWVGLGDQFSAKVWDAYFATNQLPKCSATNTSSTYKHWSEPFPDTLAFAWSDKTKKASGINGHEDGTYILNDVSITNGTYLRATYEGDSEAICARIEVFVDPRDGLVYSRVAYSSEWKKGADGKVTTKDMSCSLPAGAKAACTVKDANTVVSVSVASYVCKAGNCLKFSPAFTEKASA